MSIENKLIVVLGPTASGKTDLSIKLAKKFNGEVVSADSRQVYKGLNIGSGKITKKEMKGVPHHLLDVALPNRRFTVAQYKKLALKAIKDIKKRGKTPFLVGGSPFYIYSIIDDIIIPEVKPNWKLRKNLEKKPNSELFLMLKKLDPKRAESIDRENPRRLIRALEIVLTTKKPVPILNWGSRKSSELSVLEIGIKKSKKELAKLINKRLSKRLKNNAIINEVKNLHKNKLSWKRLEELGLEYRFISQYLQNKKNYDEMINKIQKESESFSKRQMTWFKKDKRIKWINLNKENDFKKIIKICGDFIKK